MNRIFCLSCFLLACLVPVASFAWVQTQTCDQESCGGYPRQPISWDSSKVTFYLNERGTSQMSLYQVIEVTQKSLSEWYRPEISSLEPQYGGTTSDDLVGYVINSKNNKNIIVFRDSDWMESSAMLALTTVTHNNANGDILDADIEINTMVHQFGNCDISGDAVFDFENTLTHELGHAFGLEHSPVRESTMNAYANKGDISLRSLDQDDLDAIATIYPLKHDEDCSANPLKPASTHGVLMFLMGLIACLSGRLVLGARNVE